jgi:hypothetical protein
MDIFDRLPEDLQHNVLKYVAYPQNSELLADIRDFKLSKDFIIKKYLSDGFCSNEDYKNDLNAYSWIENDLMRYWNDEVSYIDNITENNYKKMSRLLAYNIKSGIDKEKALRNFHLSNVRCPKNKINVYIGCLTMDERKEFYTRARLI